ncbi:50S ribosomal protein L11 methyltransferase [soil metagenome]
MIDDGAHMLFSPVSPMTHTATLVLSEQRATGLAETIAADTLLGERTIDASETAPGRWQVVVYFPEPPDAAERKALAFHGVFAIAELPEEDWVRKSLAGLKPVRAGRFLVHGSHDRAAARPNDIAIEIEAGEAFGTGHHGTTAGCLIAIERVVKARPIRNALDIGTGSGVLAIAIARLAAAAVVASDIDAVAVRVAHENVRLNGVAARVRTVTAPGLRHVLIASGAPYDLIVANILAGPLAALAPGIARHAASGGMIILSGLLPEQRARIVAAYRGVGLRLVRSSVLDGWLTVVFQRP